MTEDIARLIRMFSPAEQALWTHRGYPVDESVRREWARRAAREAQPPERDARWVARQKRRADAIEAFAEPYTPASAPGNTQRRAKAATARWNAQRVKRRATRVAAA